MKTDTKNTPFSNILGALPILQGKLSSINKNLQLRFAKPKKNTR